MLIAVTGLAGSGKDTFASALGSSFVKLPFANALKESCIFKFGLSHDDVFTEAGKKRFVETWGMSVREILQKEGTEATKSFWGEDFWIKRWRMSYDTYIQRGVENIIATDCRFDLEAKAIVDLGGYVIRVIRPDADSPLNEQQKQHASEQGISDKYVHKTFVNNSTQAAFKLAVAEWYGTLAK